jgi:hypothetical protein
MMIGLATITQSPFGFVLEVENKTLLRSSHERRSSRYKTLDGGAVLFDSGYSASDETETIIFLADMPKAMHDTLTQLTQLYSVLMVFLPRGAFLAHPKSINAESWTLQILGPAEVK